MKTLIVGLALAALCAASVGCGGTTGPSVVGGTAPTR